MGNFVGIGHRKIFMVLSVTYTLFMYSCIENMFIICRYDKYVHVLGNQIFIPALSSGKLYLSAAGIEPNPRGVSVRHANRYTTTPETDGLTGESSLACV